VSKMSDVLPASNMRRFVIETTRWLQQVVRRSEVPAVHALGRDTRSDRSGRRSRFLVHEQVQRCLGRLPREPDVVVAVRIVVHRRAAEVRHVGPRPVFLLLVDAGHECEFPTTDSR